MSVNADAHIMANVIRLQDDIVIAETSMLEARINQTIYRLHDLTPEEITMIEAAVQ